MSHRGPSQPPRWQQHREVLRRLYVTEGKSLEQVKEIVERDHGFCNTPKSTYEVYLRRLGLRKNLKGRQWAAIRRHLDSRPAGSRVFYCDAQLSPEKVERYTNRYKQLESELPATVPLPEDVRIEDPPDAHGSILHLHLQNFPPPSAIPHRGQNESALTIYPRITGPSTPQPADCPFRQRYGPTMDAIDEMLSSPPNLASFVMFSTPILDVRLVQALAPLLDNLPIIQFQRSIRDRTNNFSIANSDWDSGSLRTRDQVAFRDARALNLLPTPLPIGDDIFDSPPPASKLASPTSFESQLSTFKNPFHALAIVLHRLSNCQSAKDISCLMDELFQGIPGSESFFKTLIELDCPTVRAAIPGILTWVVEIDNRNLFHSLADAVLRRPSTDERRHRTLLLVLAARYENLDICKRLLRNGADPNCSAYLPRGGEDYPTPTFPLAEAARTGNIDLADILHQGGADINYADHGLTAAGHLLRELRKDNIRRDERLEMLRFLLVRGSAIHAPFHLLNRAQTLLDHALLNGDEDVRQIFDSTPAAAAQLARQMSMWGIISHTKMGRDKLERYLRTTPVPPGTTARDIQDAALSWAANRARTAAILTMVQAGFDPRPLVSTDGYLLSLETGSRHESGENYLVELFRDNPLTETSRDLASALLWHHRGTNIEYTLIAACLSSEHESVARFLFQDILDLTGASSRVLILSCAARLGGRAALSLMKELYPGAFTETAQCWNSHASPLLLSSARLDTRSGCPRLLAGTPPASAEMLGILYKEGADISSCHPCFWTPQHWIEGEQLQWLVDHLPGRGLCAGISAYSVMLPSMRRVTSGDQDTEKREAMDRSILESLHDLGIPVCSPSELMLLRDYRNFETDVHPLSFFISRKLRRELMDRVLESGIDVNGVGVLLDSETPLMAAVMANDFDLVQALVSRGAWLRQPEYDHRFTVLQLACGVRSIERDFPSGEIRGVRWGAADSRIAEFLLERGADPNGRAYYCCISPLQLAESAPIVRLLLDYGASANELVSRCWRCEGVLLRNWHFPGNETKQSFTQMDVEPTSILHLAVLRSKICGTDDARRIVGMLLKNGADVNKRVDRFCQNSSGCTWSDLGCSVLEIAAGVTLGKDMGEYGDIEMVRQFLDLQVEVNPPPSRWGPSALTAACHRQDVNMVRLLLKHGASPNLPDHDRYSSSPSPLSTAAETGNLLVVIMLLAAGADVTAPGDAPLLAAARRGKLDIVSVLLRFETRLYVVRQVISSADGLGHHEVAAYVRRHGNYQDECMDTVQECGQRLEVLD